MPEQLTSTVAGVVQAIRQLFLVLMRPRTSAGLASGREDDNYLPRESEAAGF